MTAIYDGGQAFPISDASGPIQYGMTLRDWFAGQALMGLIANPDDPIDVVESSAGMKSLIARISYEYADAMLAARNKKSEG